jgi:phage terminase small subunit
MPMTVDLKVSYGAVGDGKADDTQALLNAINDVTDQAVIYIPPGRYLLSQKIDVPKRVVLKGAGRNATTLVLTKSLSDLGNNTWINGNSQYTYGPALINFWGSGFTNTTSRMATVIR